MDDLASSSEQFLYTVKVVSNLNPAAFFFMFWSRGVFILVISMLLGWLLTRILEKAIAAEKRMDKNNFVLRASNTRTWGVALGIVFWIVGVMFWIVIVLDSRISFSGFITLYAPLLLFFLLWSIPRAVYAMFFKVYIDGDNICYKTLFGQKTYTFYDIKNVQTGSFRITLYSEAKKLFSIRTNSIGYSTFAERLRHIGFTV